MNASLFTQSTVSRIFCFIVYVITFFVVIPECTAQIDRQSVQRDSILIAARDIMGMQKYCALITVDSTGRSHARTMNPFPPEEDMTVWMATNSRSRKAREIRHNPQVSLYYADHGLATGSVAITGKAILVTDMNEIMKRKRAYWDQAFPDWKYLVLIKVIPERLEVINYKQHMVNDSTTWEVPSIEFNNE